MATICSSISTSTAGVQHCTQSWSVNHSCMCIGQCNVVRYFCFLHIHTSWKHDTIIHSGYLQISTSGQWHRPSFELCYFSLSHCWQIVLSIPLCRFRACPVLPWRHSARCMALWLPSTTLWRTYRATSSWFGPLWQCGVWPVWGWKLWLGIPKVRWTLLQILLWIRWTFLWKVGTSATVY